MSKSILIFAESPSTSYYSKADQYKTVSFQFCDMSGCDINELHADKLTFVGCYFEEGYIVDCNLKEIEFIGCFQRPGKHLCMVREMNTIGTVNVDESSLKLEVRHENYLRYTDSEPLKVEIEKTLGPLNDYPPMITEIIYAKTLHLLNNNSDNIVLIFMCGLMFKYCYLKNSDSFFSRMYEIIPTLPPKYHDHFVTYFKFLLEDEYPLGEQMENVKNYLADLE